MSDPFYKVMLDDVFEGPMDLLVYLIKKNEVDIYDIPIATITDQFLAYLTFMESLNIDVAGDFLVMAATLAQIKSKMLLPVHGPDEEDEDPRMEIARPILEYLQMKSVAEQLAERNILGETTFTRTAPPPGEDWTDDADEVVKIGLFELIDAFQRILEKAGGNGTVDVTKDKISVKDRIAWLIDILEEKESISFEEIFSASPAKSEIIVTFLAILEMVKLCLIRVVQHVQSGAIRIFYL